MKKPAVHWYLNFVNKCSLFSRMPDSLLSLITNKLHIHIKFTFPKPYKIELTKLHSPGKNTKK